MIWILVIVVIIAIYNAERLPGIVNNLKNEVPHIIEAGKKVSHDIKEKAQNVQAKKSSKKTTKKEENNEEIEETIE